MLNRIQLVNLKTIAIFIFVNILPSLLFLNFYKINPSDYFGCQTILDSILFLFIYITYKEQNKDKAWLKCQSFALLIFYSLDNLSYLLLYKFNFNYFLLGKLISFFSIQILVFCNKYFQYIKTESLWLSNIFIAVKWVFIYRIGRFYQMFFRGTSLNDKLCVSTSYFFREIDDYKSKLLDYCKSDEFAPPLRVLCAGCATGQEAYSISAYCLANHIPVKIVGIDLSKKAIFTAKKAKYIMEEELRSMDDDTKSIFLTRYKKYFVFDTNHVAPIKKVISQVEFKVEDATMIIYEKEFDFVFARKMLYYLSKKDQLKAIINFKKALNSEVTPSKNLIFCESTYRRISNLPNLMY